MNFFVSAGDEINEGPWSLSSGSSGGGDGGLLLPDHFGPGDPNVILPAGHKLRPVTCRDLRVEPQHQNLSSNKSHRLTNLRPAGQLREVGIPL